MHEIRSEARESARTPAEDLALLMMIADALGWHDPSLPSYDEILKKVKRKQALEAA